MTRLPVQITMTFASDWHVGVGFGRRGNVDRATAVDELGLPFVPAKTAVGILRDAAEIASSALDSGEPGVWARWVQAVFGSQPATSTGRPVPPRTAALIAAPLHLDAGVRRFVATAPEVRDPDRVLTRMDLVAATRVVRAGVKIDSASGTAEHETFRQTEHARAGLSVRARWVLLHPPEAPTWPAQLLLATAARIARGVGGNRRRGAGAVTVTVDGLEELEALRARFDAASEVPEPWPHTAGHHGAATTGGTEVGGGAATHRADLVLRVRRPVIVDAGMWGNVVRTRTFVPGAMLLPLLRPALDVPLAELIRSGQIVVTDATVEFAGARGWAWPRALTRSKDAPPDSTEYVNRLHSHVLDPRLRPALGNYLAPDGSAAATVKISERLHAVIDDERQRPSTDTGGLFVYQGVAAGTRLRAELYLPDHVSLDVNALAGEHRIGRSAKDDYGSVEITVTDPVPAPATAPIPAGAEFSVWVGSTVLLRNERGGYDTTATALADALGVALGVPGAVTIAEPADIFDPATGSTRGRETALVGVTRHEGWQRAWGLPRPSLVGTAAGSCLLCRTDVALDADRIAAVQARGIGQRTGEGFGRVLIDAAALRSPTARIARVEAGADVVELLESVEPNPDPVLVRAAWRSVIASTAITVAAQHYTAYLASGLTRAQLGDLRVVTGDLGEPHGRDAAAAWVTAIRDGDPQTATDWTAPRLSALEALFTTDPSEETQPVWTLLFERTPTDLPGTPALRAELAVYAVQTVLTEMLRIAGGSEVSA